MSIEFCKCGGMLIPQGDKVRCRSCNSVIDKKMEPVKMTTKQEKKETIVIENNEPDLPKTDKECPNCFKNVKAFFWMIQTRSSDEPPTQFFKCANCKHVWREYK